MGNLLFGERGQYADEEGGSRSRRFVKHSEFYTTAGYIDCQRQFICC